VLVLDSLECKQVATTPPLEEIVHFPREKKFQWFFKNRTEFNIAVLWGMGTLYYTAAVVCPWFKYLGYDIALDISLACLFGMNALMLYGTLQQQG
jgi:hypothetical protein